MRPSPPSRSLALLAGVAFAGLSVSPSRAEDAAKFEFRDGDRVVLLGGAFVERMQYDNYLETLITAAFPDRNLTFRNLGWSGDTVWGDSRGVFGGRAEGFKRLVSDVNLCQPTLLVIGYGQNEAHAGEGGLAEFRAGLNQLLDALRPTGARFLLLGPKKQQNIGPPLPDPAPYNADLRKYTQAIADVAQERGAAFVDLYDLPGETDNGLHLTDAGALEFAQALLPQLNVPTPVYSISELAELRRTIGHKNEWFFHRYRPQNETYLFLFRKHEQGNNAVEIPQFDPLVEQKEREIARLKRGAASGR